MNKQTARSGNEERGPRSPKATAARSNPTAGELADAFERRLEGAPFTAGAVALTTVLAAWIGRYGERPQMDARVFGVLLETLVDEIAARAARGGAGNVAA